MQSTNNKALGDESKNYKEKKRTLYGTWPSHYTKRQISIIKASYRCKECGKTNLYSRPSLK